MSRSIGGENKNPARSAHGHSRERASVLQDSCNGEEISMNQ